MHLWTIKTAWILISWTPWICWCELEVPTIASLYSLTSISWSLNYLKDFPQSHRVWDNEVWLYSILIATNAWNLCRASIKQDISFSTIDLPLFFPQSPSWQRWAEPSWNPSLLPSLCTTSADQWRLSDSPLYKGTMNIVFVIFSYSNEEKTAIPNTCKQSFWSRILWLKIKSRILWPKFKSWILWLKFKFLNKLNMLFLQLLLLKTLLFLWNCFSHYYFDV